jgi:GAF domain-containing protein
MDVHLVDPAAYAELAEQFALRRTLPDTVDEVIDQARKHLAADAACVTLLHAGRQWETVGASDETVAQADGWQQELGEGPCLEAAWDQHLLTVNDLANDARWPRWGPRAMELGIGSILAVEMHTDRGRLGALNLYWSSPRTFDDDEVAFAHLFARHSAVALAAARTHDHLVVAMDARTLTGQAQGVLMVCYGIEADRAFAVLQRLSQDNNVKLRVIAEEVVRRRSLPDESVLSRV